MRASINGVDGLAAIRFAGVMAHESLVCSAQIGADLLDLFELKSGVLHQDKSGCTSLPIGRSANLPFSKIICPRENIRRTRLRRARPMHDLGLRRTVRCTG